MNTHTLTPNGLPNFSAIELDGIESQLDQLLLNSKNAVDQLLLTAKPVTWTSLMLPLEDIADQISQFFAPISHLHSVMSSDKLRAVYQACLPKLSRYYTELSHNEALYQAVLSIANGSEYQQLNVAQRMVIDHQLRDFKLAGVALNNTDKEQFSQLAESLSQLGSKFEENVLDATQAWVKQVTDEKELHGIPAYAIASAKKAAEHRQLPGWVFTLEAPSYVAVITHADSRELRKNMYQAYVTRASDQGPNAGKFDNSSVMQKILTDRLALAKLVGYDNYASYSLATKMVKSPNEVLAFLQQLVDASLPKAKKEFSELEQFAKSELGMTELYSWDIAYVTEKLRKKQYDLSQEDVRPYFPEPTVKAGLFAIVARLFDVTITEVKDADVWHKDVHCYVIQDQDHQPRGYFYLDLYARNNKRGGAWMDDCRVRRRLSDGHVQLPIGFITCNFNGPMGDKPALFSHDEVITLFHEFGHALQHLLTRVDYPEVSGIHGVPWDAVELASQFLENWAWEKEALSMTARHYQTGEPLPDALFQRMQNAKNFHTGMHMVRQLEFALFDMRLHMSFDPNVQAQIQTILNQVRSQVTVTPIWSNNRFQHGFSHIFAGGYAAGYYSYKWAEVMAADAFSLFEEKGIFDRDTALKFRRTFLESGGAREPADLFKEFRGRAPRIDALLQQSGIQ